MFFLHAGDTEVGGFAITAEDDPLYVQEFLTVAQNVSMASVEFHDSAVADYFDQCVDQGLKPERFARIWCHTHPADSPRPSLTDEETFARVFGGCDWSVMFIVSRTGSTYARLSFQAGPGGQMPLGVAVDWGTWPQAAMEEPARWAAQIQGWADEYVQNIHEAQELQWAMSPVSLLSDPSQWWDYEEYDPADLWEQQQTAPPAATIPEPVAVQVRAAGEVPA